MLKIAKIIPGSPADTGSIKPGDILLKINDHDVADIIDYRYHEADNILLLQLIRNSRKYNVEIIKEIDQHAGMEFHPDKIIRCKNNCIFCFCHNNPKQLRRTLYIKDDDYRYSFLHGSFITLTNLSEQDIQRIIDLRLSPLYVSVQATDDAVRRLLFGKKTVPPVMPILRRFAENNISFHCQVVIVPGYNDGKILNKTAADLAELKPYAASLAVVPVGLTKFSNPILKTVGPKISAGLIGDVNRLRKKYGHKNNHFAYAADELFINAGIDIPSESYYDEFPQIENGVGMVRDFLNTFKRKLPSKVKGCWITGKSMIKIWRGYILPRYGFKIKLIPVSNTLFGKKVSVSGLLPGKDIADKLRKLRLKNEPVIIPPNCLNDDGLLIDDFTMDDIESITGAKVIQGSYNFGETVRMVS
ncbi:MAG: DUF512 domain-containing protein [candidate division Zixibacteria bacterium]|nr:DUF512 domain-containing protein [candidate division Zixibacteria bacterium]